MAAAKNNTTFCGGLINLFPSVPGVCRANVSIIFKNIIIKPAALILHGDTLHIEGLVEQLLHAAGLVKASGTLVSSVLE